MIALLLALLTTPSADAARVHFAKGQKLFVDQRYKDALGEFEAAQHSAPREVADLYFNIAQCNRNLGRVRPAIAAFERYLELKPDAPDRKQVRQMLLRLRTKLPPDAEPDAPADAEPSSLATMVTAALEDKATIEPAVAVDPAPATPSEPAAAAPIALELPRRQSASPPVLAVATPSEPPAESRPLYQKWWLWAGVGAAVIGTTAGLYAGLHHNASGPPTPMDMLGSIGNFDTRGH